jgi:hypothetical protein
VSARSRDGERLASALSGAGSPIQPADLESLRDCVEGVAGAFAEALTAIDAESRG